MIDDSNPGNGPYVSLEMTADELAEQMRLEAMEEGSVTALPHADSPVVVSEQPVLKAETPAPADVIVQPEETFHQPEAGLAVALPKDRRMVLQSPGWMNVAKDGGGYPGCRLISITTRFNINGSSELRLAGFDEDDGKLFIQQLKDENLPEPVLPADALNVYYKHRSNLLTVFVQPTFDGGLLVAHTTSLEGDRLEYFREYSRRISEGMQEWEDQRQAQQAKEMAEALDKQKERDRLVELGEKAEKEKTFETARALSKKVKLLKAVAFKLGGKDALKGIEESDEP